MNIHVNIGDSHVAIALKVATHNENGDDIVQFQGVKYSATISTPLASESVKAQALFELRRAMASQHTTLNNLKQILSDRGVVCTHIEPTSISAQIAQKTLIPTYNEPTTLEKFSYEGNILLPAGEWFKEESHNLPLERQMVAKGYWNKNHEDHTPFLTYLKSQHIDPPILEQFKRSLESNIEENKQTFISLFDHLGRSQIDTIEAREELNIFPWRDNIENPEITDKIKTQIKDYLRDSGFSGVVSISTPRSGPIAYTIATSNIKDAQAPFAIHSVGKIFTGLLAIMMIKKGIIDEDVLDKPVKLEESVKEIIRDHSKIISAHLEKTTLRELMLHQSGLGDYLGNYEDAIDFALKTNTAIPEIQLPENLLKFAEETIEIPDKEKGEIRYSNLGLLLVGLSIQHHFNEKNKNTEGYRYKTYDEIQQDNIFQPAGMNVSLKKPDNAVFNEKEHPVAAHICATPSGGHWTTAEDMQKFGQWICKEVETERNLKNEPKLPESGLLEKPEKKPEKPLYQLMQEYGGEFFDNGIVGHIGAIESASAEFSANVNTGTTVTVLSDRGKMGQELAAHKIFFTISQNVFSKIV